MVSNPAISQAVEKLNYRVTVGDVATKAGLDINTAQRGLLALASDASGHLQVAETGDVVYLFPQNFRTILRNKYLRLQLQEWWQKVWKVLFYLIRISFGIILILSIILIAIAITIIIFSLNSSSDDDGGGDSDGGGGGFFFMPYFWFGPDMFWVFSPDYEERRYERQQRRSSGDTSDMNFLEAVFSFLFGDGNPNANLEERRWQDIATVIRNNKGAVVAEQIAPYLDNLGTQWQREDEDFMLPVLTRFNGTPHVSPDGGIVYHFPDLQTTAGQQRQQSVPAYLREFSWPFSQASSGQLTLAGGLGVLNFVLAIILGVLLQDGTVAAQIGGLVAFVQSIYWLLLGYGTAYLAIPLIRYFWLQRRNQKIEERNQKRQERATALNRATPEVQNKLSYARQFAEETVITEQDLAYTTEDDLIQQELDQAEKIDAEWRRRLEERTDNN